MPGIQGFCAPWVLSARLRFSNCVRIVMRFPPLPHILRPVRSRPPRDCGALRPARSSLVRRLSAKCAPLGALCQNSASCESDCRIRVPIRPLTQKYRDSPFDLQSLRNGFYKFPAIKRHPAEKPAGCRFRTRVEWFARDRHARRTAFRAVCGNPAQFKAAGFTGV